ncbi:hypothetical protein JTB14_033830 [Gonioctena quinquepunctata]|nr:hypothetical protein JTB14_033830 [Gonioctena quinquepunctata]
MSAGGVCMSSMFVFPRSKAKPELLYDAPPGSTYSSLPIIRVDAGRNIFGLDWDNGVALLCFPTTYNTASITPGHKFCGTTQQIFEFEGPMMDTGLYDFANRGSFF